MGEAWRLLSNPVDENYAEGGYCSVQSFVEILQCLDDGNGMIALKDEENDVVEGLNALSDPGESTTTTFAKSMVTPQCFNQPPPNSVYV